jgi:outer membrane protein assembly factor BamD
MRNIQEVLADAEMRVGQFYNHKGSNPAAANRLNGLVDQYPLYSGADEALWLEADSYSKMGTRFRAKAGDAFTRIVRDYPLSDYANQAKKRLKEMELPIPEPDPVALNRMKYELENRKNPSMLSRSFGIFRSRPDVSGAAKSGTPAMTQPHPTLPASIPVPAATAGFTGDVTVSTPADTTALDTKPDARQTLPGQQNSGAAAAPSGTAAAPSTSSTASNEPLPTNQSYKPKKQKKAKKQKQAEPPPAPAPATAAGPDSTAQGATNPETAKH